MNTPPPLNILMVATSYPANALDWRGLFIRHMVDALARRQDVALSLWSPPGEVPGNVAYVASGRQETWLRELMEAGGIAHLLRTQGFRGIMAALRLVREMHSVYRNNSNVDVIHANWLQSAIPLHQGKQPLLVTVLGTDMQLLRLPGMKTLLRRVFSTRPSIICPNAEWMLPVLNDAFGDVATVRFVPFGIDPRWFSLDRRFEANATPKWLCVSRLTANKLGPLFDWTEPVFANGRAELHLFGPMQERITLPSWVNWHGPASPDVLRETWFPQAHGLITLSQHAEGRPQVMLEALAAGLPIVASRLPAHDDLLAGDEGGLLCDSPEAVCAALEALGDPVMNRTLGLRGRMRMQREIGTWDDCAARYVALYRQLQEQARQ